MRFKMMGIVARLDRDIIGRRGTVELESAHVGGESMHDFERTGIVDTEAAGGVGQRESLI